MTPSIFHPQGVLNWGFRDADHESIVLFHIEDLMKIIHRIVLFVFLLWWGCNHYFHILQGYLTYYGLVMPYGDIDLGQHWYK